MFVTFHIVCIVQALLHRFFGHRQLILSIFKSHTGSHHTIYSATNFERPVYSTEEASVTYTIIPVAVIIPGVAYFLLSPYLTIVAGVTVTATFLANVYLHVQYHLESTWLTRFNWFNKYKELHRMHHIDQTTNFGVIGFICDRLMGTLCKPSHESSRAGSS